MYRPDTDRSDRAERIPAPSPCTDGSAWHSHTRPPEFGVGMDPATTIPCLACRYRQRETSTPSTRTILVLMTGVYASDAQDIEHLPCRQESAKTARRRPSAQPFCSLALTRSGVTTTLTISRFLTYASPALPFPPRQPYPDRREDVPFTLPSSFSAAVPYT